MSRLLSINSYHYRRGGSDVVYLEHAALMESIGWKNAFFSMHHPMNIESEWSSYFVEELQYGHQYSVIQKFLMASKVIYSFEARKKLENLINDYQPTIAHSHCIFHHLSPSILPLLKERGIPVVMTAHELKALCPAISMRNRFGVCERCKDGNVLNVLRYQCVKDSFSTSAVVAAEALLHKKLDTYRKSVSQLVTPSRFYMNKYIEWGWSKDKIAFIPNYVDSTLFSPDFQPGSYFLYFGRISHEKGLYTLVNAAILAGVELKVVGTGPEEGRLKDLVNELGGNVQFLGYRSGKELHSLIRSSKAVVLPSEWYENAPMSVLESFALGKPVIGARIGGIPELIEEGETGWLFESGNVAELSCLLEQIGKIKAEKLSLVGKAARDYVSINFSRSGYLEKIRNVYFDLGVG